MAKEGTEKEQEYANKLSLLIKEKNKIEAQLEEAIQKVFQITMKQRGEILSGKLLKNIMIKVISGEEFLKQI